MNYLKEIKILLLCAVIVVISTSCDREPSLKYEDLPVRPILESDIIRFQKAYSDSFNAISEAIEDNSYYETTAKKHIDQNYNFEEEKVMFKIGHDSTDPYRYTYGGVLSYLIGKNKTFPNDYGIAKDNWKKIEWINEGILSDDENSDVAVVMGKVKMIKDNNDIIVQNFTMCLKRNSSGRIKIIVHKIARPCK